MKLKVCGMTDIEQLQHLDNIGVHFAGFIFYNKSARFVGEKLRPFQSQIFHLQLNKVGVFVNADLSTIQKMVKDYNLQFVQLHGDETPEFCKEVKATVPVIKAIRIAPGVQLEELLKRYNDAVDYFLFDTDSKQYGGTGKQFDWGILKEVTIHKPFFLSGGIGLEEKEAVLQFQHPNLIAIDVNSRFETAPGIKDIAAVTAFYREVIARQDS